MLCRVLSALSIYTGHKMQCLSPLTSVISIEKKYHLSRGRNIFKKQTQNRIFFLMQSTFFGRKENTITLIEFNRNHLALKYIDCSNPGSVWQLNNLGGDRSICGERELCVCVFMLHVYYHLHV